MRIFETNKGFSIVEVLIVMTLIAVLASVGIPAMLGRMSHVRLKRDARTIFTELNAARLKAIVKNTKYRVEFTVPDTYSLSVWSSGSWADDATQPTKTLLDGIDIISPGADFMVYFFPNGTATNMDSPTAVDVDICVSNTTDANDRMELEVDGSTGKVTIKTGC
jgi:prepilin-type N-terminal cleavage/methylation domain-containing protein